MGGRSKAKIFMEEMGGTGRNYISISLISIKKKNGYTDNLQAPKSAERDEKQPAWIWQPQAVSHQSDFSYNTAAGPGWGLTTDIVWTFTGLLMLLCDV